jgi:hypothetical protein
MALTSEQINEITAIINNELEQLKSNIVHLEEIILSGDLRGWMLLVAKV